MAFTFAAFCYMLSLVLCAALIFFAIWHVSNGQPLPTLFFSFFPPFIHPYLPFPPFLANTATRLPALEAYGLRRAHLRGHPLGSRVQARDATRRRPESCVPSGVEAAGVQGLGVQDLECRV